jgi:glycosyltransferase involved in cell wall biosynthesis
MSPQVSVIVPVYQRLQYLPLAIESILKQSYRDIEVVVSDNASDTDVRRVVANFSDKRLRYRRNSENRMLAGNLRAAVAETTGPLIAILSDDDLWEAGFLDALVGPLLGDPSIAFAFSDHWIIGPGGEIDEAGSAASTRTWKRDKLREGKLARSVREALVERCVPVAVSSVFRRDAVPWASIPLESGSYCDYWIAYQAARTGRGAWYSPRRLARYRVHSQSESARLSRDARITAARQSVFVRGAMVKDQAISDIHSDIRPRLTVARVRLAILELRAGRLLSAARAIGLWRGKGRFHAKESDRD